MIKYYYINFLFFKRTLLLLLMIFYSILCAAQFGVNQFKYKKKSYGTVETKVFIVENLNESNEKREVFGQTGTEIDLNRYSGNVYLEVEFSQLKLGLKKNYTDTKHKHHNKLFSLEIPQAGSSGQIPGMQLLNDKVMRVNTGSYQNIARVRYQINQGLLETVGGNIKVRFNIVGISGVEADNKYEAGKISFNYSILPNRKFIEIQKLKKEADRMFSEIEKLQEGSETYITLCKDYLTKYPGIDGKIYTDRYSKIVATLDKYAVKTTPKKETEKDLYLKIMRAKEDGEKDKIIMLCEEYQQKYRLQGSYFDVLRTWANNLDPGEEKDNIIRRYENLTEKSFYPKKKGSKKERREPAKKEPCVNCPRGKAIVNDKIKDTIKIDSSLFQEVRLGLPPSEFIEPTGEISYTDRKIIISNVKGGVKPYQVKMVDLTEENADQLSILDFKSDLKVIKLKDIALPTGKYKVIVVDDHNTEFAEIPEFDFQSSSSDWMGWIYLIMIGSFGFLGYKLYQKFFVV